MKPQPGVWYANEDDPSDQVYLYAPRDQEDDVPWYGGNGRWLRDEVIPNKLKIWYQPQVSSELQPAANPILQALSQLKETLTAKQTDYANEDPFNNFREAAQTAGITERQIALALVGIKLSRIRNLEQNNKEAVNEPLLDSYLDLAGYAIILYALARGGQQ